NVLENNPVTYVYYNLKTKKIYVGETNGFIRRHYEHLIESNPKVDYRDYTNCLVIYSSLFDKSSILDLESLILNYMIAESDVTKFVLANGNNGQTKLVYKNKEEILTEVFNKLWNNELYTLGLVDNPNVEELRERLLFKYSPFKQLSFKQKEIVDEIEKNITKKYLIEAPAGSGKSVLFT
ncbi:GIY-YIG nuclease family protein, partial [Enterococcus faecalis]|nr:GIY-YIG nuclease family protein [Enterococcus faecalis]